MNRGRVKDYECAVCHKGFRTLGGYERHQKPEPNEGLPKRKARAGQSKCSKYVRSIK